MGYDGFEEGLEEEVGEDEGGNWAVRDLRVRECYLDGVLRTVVETPIPLSHWQRMKLRDWAGKWYRKRLGEVRGWKRESVERILSELDQNTFLERPVPKSDSEKECLIFGR